MFYGPPIRDPLSIYPCIYLSIYMSIYLSIYPRPGSCRPARTASAWPRWGRRPNLSYVIVPTNPIFIVIYLIITIISIVIIISSS